MQAVEIAVEEATRVMLASPLPDYIVHDLLKMMVGHPYPILHVEQPI
jgi:hypothetical protein